MKYHVCFQSNVKITEPLATKRDQTSFIDFFKGVKVNVVQSLLQPLKPDFL
jgi:hypothetical protein